MSLLTSSFMSDLNPFSSIIVTPESFEYMPADTRRGDTRRRRRRGEMSGNDEESMFVILSSDE